MVSATGIVYVGRPRLHDLHGQIPQREADEGDLEEERLGAAVGSARDDEREGGAARRPGEAQLLDVVEGDGLEHAVLRDVEQHDGRRLALRLGDHVAQHGARRRPGEVGDGGHAEARLALQAEVGQGEPIAEARPPNAQPDAVAPLHRQELLVRGEREGRPVRVRAREAAQQVVRRHVPHRHGVLRRRAALAVPRQRVALVPAEQHALHVLVRQTAALRERRPAVQHDALPVEAHHVGAERTPLDRRLRTRQVALPVVDQLRRGRVAPVHLHLVFVPNQELVALERVLHPRMKIGATGWEAESRATGKRSAS